MEQKIDRLSVEDVEIDKLREIKPRRDDTKVSREQVTTEKITVSRRDKTRAEDTEEPRYPKELDIGRIVIEEIPEMKEELPKREISRKKESKLRSTELTVTRREVDEVPRTNVKDDVIKIGKLDVTEIDKVHLESWRVNERVKAYTERVNGAHKVVCTTTYFFNK